MSLADRKGLSLVTVPEGRFEFHGLCPSVLVCPGRVSSRASQVSPLQSESLGSGITCIDAGYIKPGLACFYLLERGGECAIIETGTSYSVASLEREMAARGIAAADVRFVIPTHVHLDHAGGAGAMMRRFPKAKLLIHPRGARHMIEPQRLIESSIQVYGRTRFRRLYGDVVPVARDRVIEMADGESVSLGGFPLEFRHTRGHADHHFCIWDVTSAGWFSGDMFGLSYPWFRFAEGDFLLPATTPTQFDPHAYLASLELLDSYSPQRIYLTHYGELSYSGQKSKLLARQVAAYRDFAPSFHKDKKGLQEALLNYSLSQIRELGVQDREQELGDLLAFDLDLNTQGLSVWLDRADRKITASSSGQPLRE